MIFIEARDPQTGLGLFDGEFGCVVTDSNRNPRLVQMDVVNTIGDGFPKFFVGKVVRIDLQRFAFRPIFSADVRLVS